MRAPWRRALGIGFWAKAIPTALVAMGVAYVIVGWLAFAAMIAFFIFKFPKLYAENYHIGEHETQAERRERMLKSGPPII